MIVKVEIRTSDRVTFWKGLTLFRKGLALFWKRHSTLLSHRIRWVTRRRLWERPVVSRWNWVLIEKENQKLRKKLKSYRRALSSGRLCSDVDRSPEILHGKSTRCDPSVCRATRLLDRERL